MNRFALTTAAIVAAGSAAPAFAAPFTSDSLSGSATAFADTNIAVSALGLNLVLDELDLPSTTVNAGGSADIDADTVSDSLALTGLTLNIDDVNVGPISDSDSDSILFGAVSASADIALNSLTTSGLTVQLVNPTTAVPFVGQSTVTFNNLDLLVTGSITADAAIGLDVSGFGVSETISETISESFVLNDVFTLSELTLDSALVGDQLTLSSTIDLVDLLPEGTLPFEITEEDIQEGGEFADLVPEEAADLVGLIDDLSVALNDVEANAAFTSTFTIPEPTTGVLLAVGGLAVMRRGTRRA